MLVFFIQLVVPFFLMVHCLFQPEPYYTLDESGTTMRVNAPESVIVCFLNNFYLLFFEVAGSWVSNLMILFFQILHV